MSCSCICSKDIELPKTINTFVFVIDSRCVYCEVGINFLCIIRIKFSFKGYIKIKWNNSHCRKLIIKILLSQFSLWFSETLPDIALSFTVSCTFCKYCCTISNIFLPYCLPADIPSIFLLLIRRKLNFTQYCRFIKPYKRTNFVLLQSTLFYRNISYVSHVNSIET